MKKPAGIAIVFGIAFVLLSCSDDKGNGPSYTVDQLVGMWMVHTYSMNGTIDVDGTVASDPPIPFDTTVVIDSTNPVDPPQPLQLNADSTYQGAVFTYLDSLLAANQITFVEQPTGSGRWWVAGNALHLESQGAADTTVLTVSLTGNEATFSTRIREDFTEEQQLGGLLGFLALLLENFTATTDLLIRISATRSS